MPGIMQVRRIPRLWPGPGLGLKLWSLGLGLSAGPGPWARAWAQDRGPGDHGPQDPMGPRAAWAPDNGARAWDLERPGPRGQAWAWTTEKAR